MSSRAASSPGGALLRSSRLFSVPKPLPEHRSSKLNLGTNKSPTMTQHSPTHQAITTPRSSREKGDWGFKRPFPLKSTMTSSTPLIRVKQIDAMENVTDFASAADLTLTLEKFRELQLAPSVPASYSEGNKQDSSYGSVHTSVFESDMDITDWAANAPANKRWKFRGPWLARLDEGSFIKYLERAVRPKRAEFRQLLKKKMVEDRNATRKAKAMEEGHDQWQKVSESDISPEEFTEYLRLIRHDRATLYAVISKFLDFAPLAVPVGIKSALEPEAQNLKSPYGKTGPPSTHPSAGIGYLRTNAIVENHPVYGPQARRSPVVSRILSPRNGPNSPKLGVAGFVADIPDKSDSPFNANNRSRNRERIDGISQLETRKYGGAKAYVIPKKATIDPSGKVILEVEDTDPVSLVVALEKKTPKGQVYDEKVEKPKSLMYDAKTQRPNRRAASERQQKMVDEAASDSRMGQLAEEEQAAVTARMDQLADEMLEPSAPQEQGAKKDGEQKENSSKYFGLDM